MMLLFFLILSMFVLHFQFTVEAYLSNEPEPGTFDHTRWRVAAWLEQDHMKAFFIVIVCINAVLIGVQVSLPAAHSSP